MKFQGKVVLITGKYFNVSTGTFHVYDLELISMTSQMQ